MSFKVVHIHHSLMKFIEVPGDDEILEKAKYLEVAYYLTRLAKGYAKRLTRISPSQVL